MNLRQVYSGRLQYIPLLNISSNCFLIKLKLNFAGSLLWCVKVNRTGNLSELIKQADTAMYKSESAGRNRLSFYSDSDSG